MPSKTRATAFSRFLIVVALMAALFSGVRYALEETPWGRDLHEELQQAAPADAAPADAAPVEAAPAADPPADEAPAPSGAPDPQ